LSILIFKSLASFAVNGENLLSFEIASQLDYDFKKFDTAWASYYGILARAYIMDEEVKKFIERYPDCVIVSIGCGLD